MLFDPKAFVDASVLGLPLTGVIIALVTWISQTFNLVGRQSLIASMVTGLVLGVGYQVSQAMPADFAGWFAALVYGLALGLLASGIYDTGKKIARRV